MIKGVAFDMDGLMFDTERLAVKAWRFAGAQMGYRVPEELVLKTLGLNAENSRQIFTQHFGSDFDFNSARNMRVDYVTDYIRKNGMPLKTGLMELLLYLKANHYRYTVATSTDRERTAYYFEKAGISGFFDEIVCGDMIVRGKPEPDIYLKAGSIMGLNPDECIALEDSPSGILSAFRAGMKPVMIPDLIEPDKETDKMLYAKLPSLLHVIVLLGQQS